MFIDLLAKINSSNELVFLSLYSAMNAFTRRGHDLFVFIFFLGKGYEIIKDTKKKKMLDDIFYLENRTVKH